MLESRARYDARAQPLLWGITGDIAPAPGEAHKSRQLSWRAEPPCVGANVSGPLTGKSLLPERRQTLLALLFFNLSQQAKQSRNLQLRPCDGGAIPCHHRGSSTRQSDTLRACVVAFTSSAR